MNKKKRAAAMGGVAVLVGGALAIWAARGPREPTYEGRVLSDWLNHHVASSAAMPAYGSQGWQKAEEALRAIGTNGIPVLVEMIQAEDPPRLVQTLADLGRRIGLRIELRPASHRVEEAEYAFRVLNTNAVSVVPELIRVYERNVSPVSQRSAAMALGHIGKGAREALPVLIRDFAHTNQEVRFYAVSAVTYIGDDANVVIPALVSALKDPYVSVRWNALSGLSGFWRAASNAVPEILKMTNDPGISGDRSITQQVAIALWRIAPEKTGLPLVVEDATPIISGGRTIQALKIDYFGERKTLVSPGRTVPTVVQYWNSDPRPSVKLYRGDKENDVNDQFLGEFEVLDVGEEKDVNISTLVIIADGQILLNVRDNTRERFLAVRRK